MRSMNKKLSFSTPTVSNLKKKLRKQVYSQNIMIMKTSFEDRLLEFKAQLLLLMGGVGALANFLIILCFICKNGKKSQPAS